MVGREYIELLAPAREVEHGIEAIKYGADAVYIGGPAFSARSAAGNSLEDIAKLVEFAHVYNARIYVALNTILTDKEQELFTDYVATYIKFSSLCNADSFTVGFRLGARFTFDTFIDNKKG